MLLAVGCGTAEAVLKLLHTKPELIGGAVLYLRIYFLGMPALAVFNFGNAVFSAVGDTRRPLFYLSVAGVVNVVLNLFFVIACGLDVAGVAMASVISQYISAVLVVTALFRSREGYGLRLWALRFNKSRTRAIVAIGIPSGMQNGIFELANLFIQMGVNTFSATMVAGNSAATNADALVYDVMAAFYTACGSFIEEPWMKSTQDWLSNLKLRLSYGVSGNNNIPSGQTSRTYSIKESSWLHLQNSWLTTGNAMSNPDRLLRDHLRLTERNLFDLGKLLQ